MFGGKGFSSETWKKIPYLPELVETHIPQLIEQAVDYISQYFPEPTAELPSDVTSNVTTEVTTKIPPTPTKQLTSDSIKNQNSTPVPILKSPSTSTSNDGWEKTRVFKDQNDDDDDSVF